MTLGGARSLDAVSQELGKSTDLMARWSGRWGWVASAAAYDAHMAAIAQAAREAQAAADAAEWERRRGELRHQEWQASQKLMGRANEMLAWPTERVTKVEKEVKRPDGKLIQEITITEPVGWRAGDIPEYVETASKIARLAAEMETKRTTSTTTLQGPDGGPVMLAVPGPTPLALQLQARLATASDAERIALIAQYDALAAAAQALGGLLAPPPKQEEPADE